MMQTCPKCGFVQPEDKYCANCGLDIENFKPAPTPFLKRLLQSTTFQIGVVVLLVIFGTTFIFLSQRARVEKRLSMSVPNVKSWRAEPENKQAAESTNSDTSASDDQNHGNTPNATGQISKPAANAPVVVSEPQNASEQHKNVAPVPTELSIGFYEVSRAALMLFASEGQILSETPQSRSVALTISRPLEKLRERDPNAKQIGDVIHQNLQEGTPINLDFTHIANLQGGASNLGMTLNINPMHVTSDNIELSLDLIFNMRNQAGSSLITNEVNSSYSFAPKSTLMLSGFFPHEKLYRPDLMAFNSTPIAIYTSPEFLNSVTDLVILIQSK